MARIASNPILQLIRRAVEDRHGLQLSHHDLLRRFRDQQDEAPFHTLLPRHGPMELDVCRGVLANEADAEDAFQATFLTLARKGASIRKAASVGSWLHGVAYFDRTNSTAPDRPKALGDFFDGYKVHAIPDSVVVDQNGHIAAHGRLHDMWQKARELAAMPPKRTGK